MELIRIPEAAERLGVSRQVVYRLLNYGLLTKYEIMGITAINAAELDKPEVRDRRAGRRVGFSPPKK